MSLHITTSRGDSPPQRDFLPNTRRRASERDLSIRMHARRSYSSVARPVQRECVIQLQDERDETQRDY